MKRAKKSTTRKSSTGGGVSKIVRPKAVQKKVKAKPAVRKAVKKALDVIIPAVSAMTPLAPITPVVSELTREYSGTLADKMGDKMGFGCRRGGSLRVGTDYSQFQHTRSPAMNPVLPLPDWSKPNFTHTGAKVGGMLRGGSYLPAGY